MSERRRLGAMRQDRRTGDRRQEERHVAAHSVRFLRSTDTQPTVFEAELQNMSGSGLQLRSQQELTIGESLLIEVISQQRRFSLPAVVMWAEPQDGEGFRVGCELRIVLTPLQHTLLSGLVAIRA